jgi:GNAT superfamily N-acetyltransferase
MHLKGALHVHTTCSDGRLTIPEAVAVYEALGFDFIALTDHDHLLRPDCYAAIPHIRTRLIIFTGVEMTVFEKGYIHINRIFGDRETLYVFNHPSELDLPISKAMERIQVIGRQFPLDAVEITSKGFRTPEYDIPQIPYAKIATDDSHARTGCGRAWVETNLQRKRHSVRASPTARSPNA